MYAYYNIEKDKKIDPIKFLPMGLPYIVFNLKDPFSIHKSNLNKGILEDGNLIVGQMVNYYYLVPQGTLTSLSVIFQPTGLYRLLNVPVHELIDYGYSVEDILKNKLRPLYERLLGENKESFELVRYLDEFFIAELPSTNRQYEFINHAINYIHNTKACVTINQLTDLVSISGRTFRRRFLESVGISCKRYICLRRLNHILNAVKKQQPLEINWGKVACCSGYYDQMHFIKSFKQFCGENPTDYMNRYNNPRHALEQYFLSASE